MGRGGLRVAPFFHAPQAARSSRRGVASLDDPAGDRVIRSEAMTGAGGCGLSSPPFASGDQRFARRPISAARQPIGTPACAFEVRIVSDDFTLVTFGAEVSLVVRIRWKLSRSCATIFRIKSISPFSM